MFGLSWGQIAIIVLVGVFVLGPERIPTAVTWVMTSLRKVRTMAAGAQAELRREIGPELDELRRQVADLQSLKEIQELRDLRDLHPKRLIGKNILGDEFSGGISGFLGLNDAPGTANGAATAKTATGVAAAAAGAAGVVGEVGARNAGVEAPTPAGTAAGGSDTGPGVSAGAGAATDANLTTAAAMAQGPAVPGTAPPPHLPPSMVKSNFAGPRASTKPRLIGERPAVVERPPFDPDGT